MVRNAAAAAVATFGGLALGVASEADHSGFHVVSPSEGMAVLADRPYTVTWTGNFAKSFVEIDLYYCGPDCREDECGEWVTSLCPYGERGCPDNEGDYDIVMPEPLTAAEPGGVYKVLVMDAHDENNWSCSGGFDLVSAEDVVIDEGADWTPGMTVTAPREGDLAYAGETYTVRFDYFDQIGSSVGRFSIDLFESNGGDGCDGAYVASVCDKPSIGCKDSKGDYDIQIPKDTPEGYYKIRVSPFDDISTSGCSGEFVVVPATDEEDDMSFSFSYDN